MTEAAPKVIVIPAKAETPQGQEKKRHLRVAAYCRVSTDSEEQLTSYQNQLAYYTEKIMKEPNWTMAGLFADEGITGTSAKRRKEFLRMLRQCRQGKIDLILTKSVSRFARNTVDTLTYTRELRSLGIPVLFEEQNINSIHPESEFLITLHGAFAQSESESTSSRVSWGKRQSMRSGRAIFQYKWLLGYERGPDGRPAVVPEEAEVVRSIYQWYLAGDTLRAIKDRLEAQGTPTAAGSTEWTITNLRGILSNEKYCGDVLMQKTFVADCISKKVVPNTGQLDKYLLPDHHEAIVSRAEFDAVQLEMARRRALRGATRKSAPTGLGRYSGKYALSGLLFCGECGTAYRRCVWTQKGEKRPVWRCVSRLDYGKKYCKHSPTLDEGALQRTVLAAEYLQASYPKRKGFSPRNLRRMRAFALAYGDRPDLLEKALRLGWSQNVVLLEQCETAQDRAPYLDAALRFGWSKAELQAWLQSGLEPAPALDAPEEICYNEEKQSAEGMEGDQDSFCVPWKYLPEPHGRVYHEASGEGGGTGGEVPDRLGSHQPGGAGEPGLPAGPEEAGGAWHLLRRPHGPAAPEPGLRRLRPAHRHGLCQPAKYAPHLRRGLRRQNAPPTGICRPAGFGGPGKATGFSRERRSKGAIAVFAAGGNGEARTLLRRGRRPLVHPGF